MTLVRRSAVVSAVLSYLLVVLSGVRITTARIGCLDWPLCQGQVISPVQLPPLVGYSYQAIALVATVLLGVTAGAAWRSRRRDRLVWGAAAALFLLLVLQMLLAAGVVAGMRPVVILVAQPVPGMVILGTLLVLATAAFNPMPQAWPRMGARARREARHYRVVVMGTTLASFVLLVTGGAGAEAGTPGGLIHQATTVVVGLLLLLTFWQTYRQRRSQPRLLQAAAISGALFLVQALIGAGFLVGLPTEELGALHLATATLVWASLMVFTVMVLRLPAPAAQAVATGRPGVSRTAEADSPLAAAIRDYVALTKPRVISLLLVTTLAAMLVAARGLPGLGLVVWTMLGGYLAAGGANAINMYFDHDIDVIMSRTRKRPVPSKRVPRARALIFGLLLGVLSFAIFAAFVNVLSGLLALAGLLYYVLIYTFWLKRSSPQNIVIGGAAGAFPPLVGWAAVTNGIDLTAIWLFVIVFYWTPPHFWALALMRRTDYANAGVPMLPVVYGEAETRRQILLYSLLMIAVTIVLVPFRMMGWLYLVSALVLAGIWMVYAVRIWRDGSPEATWGLYKYSLLYLALLFAAMAADRMLL